MASKIAKYLCFFTLGIACLWGDSGFDYLEQFNQPARFKPSRRPQQRKTPAIKTPQKPAQNPVAKAPVRPKPSPKKSIVKAPEKAKPVEEKPIAKVPEKAKPVEEKPIAKAPEKAKPVEEKPIAKAPEKAKPVEEKPIAKAPEKAKPIEEKPIAKAPEKAKPVEQKPIAKAPEKPIFPCRSSQFAVLQFPGKSQLYFSPLFEVMFGRNAAQGADLSKYKGSEYYPPRVAHEASVLIRRLTKHAYQTDETYASNLFSFSYAYRYFLEEYPDIKLICFICDLRDLTVELAHTHGEYIEEHLGHPADLDEKILWLITEGFGTKRDSYLSLKGQTAEAIHWMRNPNVLFIKMEDIVAMKGKTLSRIDCISSLADYLDVNVSEKDMNKLSLIYEAKIKALPATDKSFINCWKHYFNEEHIEEFKKRLGAHLIALGYESDYNW